MATGTDPILDRPGLALSNLLAGNYGAVGRSLFSPESLSPLEAQDIMDRAGIGNDTPYDKILRTITNPAVLIGAALALRFPVATTKNLFKYSEQVQRAAANPIFAKLRGLPAIFKDMPELVKAWSSAFRASKEFREKYLMRAGSLVENFEAEAGRVFGRRDQYLASVLSGNLHRGIRGYAGRVDSPLNAAAVEAAADRPLRKLVSGFREIYDDIFVEMFAEPGSEQALRSAIKIKDEKRVQALMRKKLPLKMRQDMAKRGLGLGDYRSDYMPQMLTKQMSTPEQMARAMFTDDRKIAQAAAEKGIDNPVSDHLLKLRYRMIPDPEHLAMFPEFVDPAKMQQYRKFADNFSKPIVLARGLDDQISVQPWYSLNFLNTFELYTHSMGGTKAWTLPGPGGAKPAGQALLEQLGKLRERKDFLRANLLTDTYIPLAQGRMSFQESMAAQQYSNGLKWADEFLKSPAMQNLLPEGSTVRRFLSDAIERGAAQPSSWRRVSGSAAGWLYLSTLGANVGSATLNLMQTLMTTMPTIGARATMKGVERTYDKAKRYMRLRMDGLDDFAAMQKAFPEFVAEGILENPALEDMRLAMGKAWDDSRVVARTRFGQKVDRVKQSMMLLFQGTERFNRLVAYEGTVWKALDEGLDLTQASEIGRKVVQATQFLGGPETAPAAIATMSPLARQYMQFPWKTAEFMFDTAVTLGSGQQAGFLGRNWGTLGRALMASGLAYGGAKEFLGADISQGLITGALPVPQEDNPFYPFPIVPPAFQMIGNIGRAAIEGDAERLSKVAPLLVPGGIPITRGLGLVPGVGGPRMGRALGRYWADYNAALPTGEIPVFSRNGNLLGYESPLQIALRGMGIPGAGGMLQDESEAVNMLLKNRDRIREHRRSYLDAMAVNDTNRMMSLSDSFQRAYGMPLVIKKEHVEAARLRQNVPRLERILNQLPPELRPQFAAVIQQALMAHGPQFLGIDPGMLTAQPTPQKRMPYRQALPSTLNRQGQFQTRMGPMDRMNPYQIQTNQLPNTGALGFTSMNF